MRRRPLGAFPAARCGRARPLAWLVAPILALLALAIPHAPALALKPIAVAPDQDRIEITTLGEIYESRGDSLQIETIGGDGVTSRMTVGATTPGTNPNWLVFALSNPSDKAIERWLTAERYTVLGSGAVWPDLDARRIEAVTPSLGFVPERIRSDRADVFRITLEPGQTITYVTELASDRLARVYLWKPLDYELKVRERQLVNGIMLGATGLLAVFLTAIFAANHKVIFPASALVAYCVLAYLCIDFGFFHKLFQLRPEEIAVHRAAGEAALAASLVIFLYTFLRLGLGHGLVRMVMLLWIAAQLSLVAVAVVDPRLASTFARLSLLAIGGAGALLTLYLALRGQDRALSLIPSWLLFLVWLFLAGVILAGRLSGEMASLGLAGGLVVILLILGVTVTQYAFRSLEPLYGAAPTELQTRSLAIDGAGAVIWEWNARRDEIKVHPMIEAALGLAAGELSTKVEDFAKHLHVADRERFRLMLWSIQERSGGRIRSDFRLRQADNSYRWFELEAASVPSSDRRAVRCVGLMRDVTEARRSHERLLHDAVHDTLTGLPNRELFGDRLGVAMLRAKSEPGVRPTVLVIDIDKFRSANASFGFVAGDSLLLTIARRLQRHLGPQDTLARVGGDQFAILFVAEQDPRALASLAERIRRSLRSPIKISGKELVVTGSLGIAVYDGEEESQHDLLKEAEMAMFRAKRGGADRIEIFSPDMRGDRTDRAALAADLRKALEKGQIKVLYQPIVSLATEELAGFEALVRWEHPKAGMMNPAAFVPVAEESDLIVKLGAHVLMRAAQDAARWQKELPRPEAPLFVSVNVASRQLFRQDLIQEIRHVIGRAIVPRGSLRLEVSEALVMDNPEQAAEILERLRAAGAELALDDFGAGHSALSYLERLPFDTLKVDAALIKAGESGNGAGSAIVRSIVALAHELERKVVAQGIEGPNDVSFLRSIGCEYAQGFYYGEPMPDRDVLQLLKLVKKSERKLQPRGFFRAKPRKVRAEPEPTGTPAAVAGETALASSAIQPSVPPNQASAAPAAAAKPTKDGKARAPASLPGSMVRPRLRSAKETPVPQSSGAGPVPPAGEDGPRHPSELVPPPVAAQPPSRPVAAAGPALSPPGPAKVPPGPAEQVPLAAALAGGPSPAPPVLAPRPPGAGPESARVPRSGVLPGPLLAPPPPPPPPATRPAPAPSIVSPAASPPHVLPRNPPDMRRPGPAQDHPATPAPRAAGVSSGATPSPHGGAGLAPDFSTLPPSIAESLARLAGISKDGLGPKPGPKG